MTPNEAAKATGYSRSGIMKAIKEGRLSARKTNHGWFIDPDDLSLWSNTSVEKSHDTDMQLEISGLRSEVKVLRELVESQRSEIEFLRETVKSSKHKTFWDWFRRG